MSAGPVIPGAPPLPRVPPSQTPTGGSYSCPSGYHLDDRTGQCAQNCRGGFQAFQGDCLKVCPPGMTLNDDKICIRPTFSRAFYVNESTVKSTSLLAVGSSNGSAGQLVLGSYQDTNKDITFQEPVQLQSKALTISQVDATTITSTGDITRFLVGELMADNANNQQGTLVSCLQTIDVVRQSSTGTASLSGLGNGLSSTNANTSVQGLVQSNGPEQVPVENVPDLTKVIARVQEEGGPGRYLDSRVQTSGTSQQQYVTGPSTLVESQATNSAIQTVPSSAAKIVPVPSTNRIQVRTDVGSAQNNTIFNLTGSFKDGNFVQQADEPALEVSGVLDLVLSGTQALIANQGIQAGGTGATGATGIAQFGLSAIGEVINQSTQTPLARIESADFVVASSLDARVFEFSNEALYPAGSLPTALQKPRQDNSQQQINQEMNQGFVVCGLPVVARDLNQANFSSYQPLEKQGIVTENLWENPKQLNTNLSTVYDGESNRLQVTHTQRLPRPVAFNELGQAQTGNNTSTTFTAQEVQNTLYLFGRGFAAKNPQNQNIGSLPESVLSQTSEYGYNARDAVDLSGLAYFTGTTGPTGSNPLHPGLWIKSGTQSTTFNYDGPIEAVPMSQQPFCGLGDMFYNASTDSIAMSFTNASPLSTVSSERVGSLGGLGQTKQSVLRFPYTGKPALLQLPANCINVHVILWGAGGSCEAGEGGSGAQIEGDLVPSNDPTWWNLGVPSQLQILVGGGGLSDSSFPKQTFGGGGGGSSNGLGQGGGRTAIQSLADVSKLQNVWVDRIVAAGGGGSSGEALGGNAGHFVVDIGNGKQYSQGSSGSPGKNAGQGSYIELSLVKDQVRKAQAGQGGSTQGLGFGSNAQSGSSGIGGTSAGFPAGSNALGSGGGGGGYFGGGAAAFLGNVDNDLDVHSGGGGGCSMGPQGLLKNLQSAPGQYSMGPQVSNLAKALIGNEIVAAGGSGSSNRPTGAPGYAVVILTLSHLSGASLKNALGSASPTNDFPLQQSVSGFDPRVKSPFQLQGNSDDAFRLEKASFGQYTRNGDLVGPTNPSNPLTAVFVSSNFIVAAEWGPLQDTTDPNNVIERLWCAGSTSENSRTFATLTTQFASLFPNLKNVQAIRNVSGDTGSTNSTTLALLGEGIYIATFITNNDGTLSVINVQEATSSIDNQSFAGKLTFNDGNQNGNNGGQFIAAGSPTNVSMTLNIQVNALPQFAKGTAASDVSAACWQQALQNGWSRANGSSSTSAQSFVPATPSAMAKNIRKKYLGMVQDNSIKVATNGQSMVSMGGQLEIPVQDSSSGIQAGITTGSPQAFVVRDQGNTNGLTSYWADFSTSTNSNSCLNPTIIQTVAPVATLDTLTAHNGPILRSPSTLLQSLNGGNGFLQALSEQTLQGSNGASIQLSGGFASGPLSSQVQLAMDLPHLYTGTIDTVPVTSVVQTQQTTDGVSAEQQQSPSNNGIVYNLFSRFLDVAFLPDPVDPTHGFYLAVGSFTQDLNLCWLLGGLPLVGTSSGPITTINGQRVQVHGVVPQNLDPSVTKTQLMNGCLWILSTRDLENQVTSGVNAVWKARPLWTTRKEEHFYNVFKIKTLDVSPDIWNNSIDNPSQVPNQSEAYQKAFFSTNFGLQTLTYDQVKTAYNQDLLVAQQPITSLQASSGSSLAQAYQSIAFADSPPTQQTFNDEAYIVALPAADDMVCKKDECTFCANQMYNTVQYQGNLGTVESICLEKYLSLEPQSGDEPAQVGLDTQADSQSYMALLDIAQTPANQQLVGPNIQLQETTRNNGTLFFGNILQGPYSGPDGFNAALGPGRAVNSPQINGINDSTGSTQISYRVRSPTRDQNFQEVEQPWQLDPFLGIPTSQGNDSIELSPWDSYIQARQALRATRGLNATVPNVGGLVMDQPDSKLQFGQVDAGKSDYNGLLITRQIEDATRGILPTQTPETQTTAYYPGTIGTDPITAPFAKVNATPVQPTWFQDIESGLTFGTQDLQPMTGPTGQQFVPPMLSLFPNLDFYFADFQKTQAINAATAQADPSVLNSLQNFASLVVTKSNDAQALSNFLDLDLTHFQSTNSDESPNLSKTLAQVPVASQALQTQQASRLVCPMQNNVQSVMFESDSNDILRRKPMIIPSVTTNLFRARNWSFQWLKDPNAISDDFADPNSFVFAQGQLMNDQPALAMSTLSANLPTGMSEFLQPDPFVMSNFGPGTNLALAMKTQAYSPAVFPNGAFMYTLGLSLLKFPEGSNPQIVTKEALGGGQVEDQVWPLQVPNLPVPTSAPATTILMPDDSPLQSNQVAVWLAEDANFLGPQSKSPQYANCHGVYFSNAHTEGTAYKWNVSTDQTNEPVVLMKTQMDVFVNCNLMNNDSQNQIFDFARPQIQQPTWQQSMTEFVNANDIAFKNNWTPLERVIFTDPMTHDEAGLGGFGSSTKNLVWTLRDLRDYIFETLGIPGVQILPVPVYNRVILSSTAVPLNGQGQVPRVFNVDQDLSASAPLNSYGPYSQDTGLKVPVVTSQQTELTSAGQRVGTATTVLNFLRWSFELTLPIIASSRAIEIQQKLFPKDFVQEKILSNLQINPLLWTPNLDNFDAQALTQNQTVTFNAINTCGFDLSPANVSNGTTLIQNDNFNLVNFYGLNLDLLAQFNDKTRAQKLTVSRSTNRTPKNVSSVGLTDSLQQSTASSLIRCDSVPLTVTYLDASYQFYNTALSRDKYFTAQVFFANPYVPQFPPQSFATDNFQPTEQGYYFVGLSNNTEGIGRNPSNQGKWPWWSNVLDPQTQISANPSSVVPPQLRALSIRFLNPQSNMEAWRPANNKVSGISPNTLIPIYTNPQNFGMVFRGIPTYIPSDGLPFVPNNQMRRFKFQLQSIKDSHVASMVIPYVQSNFDTDIVNPQNNALAPGMKLPLNQFRGMVQQPVPNNFLAFQSVSGTSVSSLLSKGLTALEDKPFGLYAGPSLCQKPYTFFTELVPRNNTARQPTQSATQSIANDTNFLRPLTVDITKPQASKENPILIVTNPQMDIQHNGFNGAWIQPPEAGLYKALQQFPLSVYYGDQGRSFDPILGDPPLTSDQVNSLANGKLQPAQVRAQLGIATVQAHNDKVLIRVTKSGWLNFPNWACYVPPKQYFQGKTDGPTDVNDLFFAQVPDGVDPTVPFDYTLGNIRQPKTTDQSVQNSGTAFGSLRGGWTGGIVMTNRNQNDFKQFVFGQEVTTTNLQVPPAFGWVLAQFGSPAQADCETYKQGSFPQDYNLAVNLLEPPSQLPTQTLTQTTNNGTPVAYKINQNFQYVYQNNDPQNGNPFVPMPLDQPYPQTGTDLNGTRNVQQANSGPYATGIQGQPSFLVSTCGNSVFTDDSNTGTIPVQATATSIQPPTNNVFFPQNTTTGYSFDPYNVEPESQAFRFDPGGILNVTSNDPTTSEQANAAGTVGVSIQIDTRRGDTLCFTQTALQRMRARAKNIPGIASQPAFEFDSLPGATDVSQGRQQDNNGLIANQNLSWVPNVMLANMSIETPFQNPAEGVVAKANTPGYGAPGTMDDDDPQVICCYFSESPDFTTTSPLNSKKRVQSTSEFVKNGTSESPESQPNNSACVDVQQVQPPSSYLLDVQAPSSTLNAVNVSVQTPLVSPLMCQPAKADQQDAQPVSPWIPQWTPDWSGLGLSLCKQKPNLQGSFNWTLENLDPSTDSILQPANLPVFAPSSPFLKYLKMFQPLCSRVYSAASGNEKTSWVNQLGAIEPSVTVVQVGQNSSGIIPYQAAWPIQKGPKEAFQQWNKPVNDNPQQSNPLKPGGLQSPSLRQFHFVLPTEYETGVTSINYNSNLADVNRVILGSDTGTLRLYDFKENVTLSEVPRGSFVYMVADGAGGLIPRFVNVSQIFSIVWFQKRWFVATDQGVFWTALDDSVPFLQGQTEETIRNFVAPTIRFVQLPPKAYLKDSKIDSLQKENHGFPPCTFLDKRFNGKRSVLIASYPDQAQGFFGPHRSKIFPQLQDFQTQAVINGLPLNRGQSFGLGAGSQAAQPAEVATSQVATKLQMGGTNGGSPEVCQSFQLIQKTSNRGLREFRQAAKFTGLPTVGATWKTLSSASTSVIGLPVMINSQLTDLAIVQNKVLQTSMQFPFGAFQPNTGQPAANPRGQPPNTFLFGVANGGARSFLNATNEILCPMPTQNTFQKDPDTGLVVNFSRPRGNRVTNGNDPYGDSTIRTCQVVSITETLPLDIVINTNQPVVDLFVNKFFAGMTTKIKASTTIFQDTNQTGDPARWTSLQGQLWQTYGQQQNLLDTTEVRAAPQVQDAVGIQPGALGIGIRCEPQNLTSPPPGSSGINQPIVHPSYFSELIFDTYNQSFWGFQSDQVMQQAYIVNPNLGPLPFPGPTTITQDFSANANDCCMWFQAINPAAQYNSAIFQYKTNGRKAQFEPKTYQRDSYLNRGSSTIQNNEQVPPLFETLFENIWVSKANLIFPNDTIGDFAQGPTNNSKAGETNGTLTWSLGGPYSASPLQMSIALSNNGVVTNTTGDKYVAQSTLQQDSAVTNTQQIAPSFGLPSLSTQVVMDQNPQTTEFWAAGMGLNVDDKLQMSTVVQTLPDVIQSPEFQAQAKKTSRMMICVNSGQVGYPFGGVPTSASDLLPSTLNWHQVINELPQVTPDGKTSNKKQVTLLSESMKGTKGANALGGPSKVNCFGFSPTITVICGQASTKSASVNGGKPTRTTSLWYRFNGTDQWYSVNLLVAGEVTAITFVGYGWYIATWNVSNDIGVSNLYFASANFSVVAIMDTWGPNQNSIKVSKLASLSIGQVQPCNTEAGFEPNPLNPKQCLKKCPKGQVPFNDLCALECPTEAGQKATDLANECVPPRYKPKLLPAQARNTSAAGNASDAQGQSEKVPENSLSPEEGPWKFVWTVVGGLVVVTFITLMVLVLYQMYNVAKPKFAGNVPLKLKKT